MAVRWAGHLRCGRRAVPVEAGEFQGHPEAPQSTRTTSDQARRPIRLHQHRVGIGGGGGRAVDCRCRLHLPECAGGRRLRARRHLGSGAARGGGGRRDRHEVRDCAVGNGTCAELLAQNTDVVVVDDFSNSYPAALDALARLSGISPAVHHVDLRDASGLERVFSSHDIVAVIHFAAKKAVGESMTIPLDYFDVNVGGTISLLRAMRAHGVHKIVFSSSCSVYGDQYSRPIAEDDPPAPVNPYARSKLICEQMLESACGTYADLSVIALRYFNPAGAHPSGLIGECPRGVPSNVVPHMVRVAAGQLEKRSEERRVGKESRSR